MAPERGPLLHVAPVLATFRPLRLDDGLLAVRPTSFRLNHDAWTAAVLTDRDAWATRAADAYINIGLREPDRIGRGSTGEQRSDGQQSGRRRDCEWFLSGVQQPPQQRPDRIVPPAGDETLRHHDIGLS